MIRFISKKAWGKRKENVFRRWNWLKHSVRLTYVNTAFANHVSRKYIYSDTEELASTFSQIVEQIEIIQKVSY